MKETEISCNGSDDRRNVYPPAAGTTITTAAEMAAARNEDPERVPSVTVDNMLNGSVKAGFARAIEILGSGFDPDQDWGLHRL